jgi:membrane fusion protein
VSQRQSLFRLEAIEYVQQRRWGEAALPKLPGVIVLFYTILLAAALIIIFLFRVHYARKETVPGYLAPSAGVVRVYAPRPGTISAIHVEEGQSVGEGQALLTVSVDQTASDGANVDVSVLDALARQKTLLGERIATQESLGAAERKRLEAQISGLEAEVTQMELQVSAQEERARLSASRASTGAELSARGVLSEAESRLRREAYLEQRRSLAALIQDLVNKRNQLVMLHLALEQLPIATAERIQLLRNEILETEQRIAEIEGRRAFVVRAPVAGRISALQALEGRTADPRQSQLSILPDDGRLHAELLMPTRAAGLVRRGQEVRILYEAFPYQRFGTYRGRIAMVSTTVLMPGDVTAPVTPHEPSYRAIALLERQDIANGAEATPLRPDMLLRGEIVLERRSLIAWLLDPILRVRLS